MSYTSQGLHEIKRQWNEDVDMFEKQDVFDFMFKNFDKVLEIALYLDSQHVPEEDSDPDPDKTTIHVNKILVNAIWLLQRLYVNQKDIDYELLEEKRTKSIYAIADYLDIKYD